MALGLSSMARVQPQVASHSRRLLVQMAALSCMSITAHGYMPFWFPWPHRLVRRLRVWPSRYGGQVNIQHPTRNRSDGEVGMEESNGKACHSSSGHVAASDLAWAVQDGRGHCTHGRWSKANAGPGRDRHLDGPIASVIDVRQAALASSGLVARGRRGQVHNCSPPGQRARRTARTPPESRHEAAVKQRGAARWTAKRIRPLLCTMMSCLSGSGGHGVARRRALAALTLALASSFEARHRRNGARRPVRVGHSSWRLEGT
jgi:hypothetical protein